MFQTIKKQTRPSTNIDFYTAEQVQKNPTYLEHFMKNYVRTGKFLYNETDVSIDGLELITKAVWKDQQSVEEFRNDPVVIEQFISAKTAYLNSNNITEEIISTSALS